MSETVGQAIINARQVVPDMPQTLPATTASAVAVSFGGFTLPAGTYAVMVTQLNDYGETIAAGETTGINVGANGGIQITSALQPSAKRIRAYLTLPGGAPGTEQQFTEYTAGNSIHFLRMAGGLLDYAGLQSQINNPLYVLQQTWIEITSLWYDGWWMKGGDRGQFFRRNTITSSILSSASVSVYNNQMVLEVYPQPARTGAATTLANPMSSTDTSATLTSTSGFVLPFGFVNIDGETMAYGAINGNQLTGLIRGLGGSGAVAHLAATPALELNLFWSGKRQIDPSFAPGSSASVLPVPNGWAILLAQYAAGRAKNIEHDGQYWKQLNDDIKASIKDWGRTEKGIVRRRQVGGDGSPSAYYSDLAGGLIIN